MTESGDRQRRDDSGTGKGESAHTSLEAVCELGDECHHLVIPIVPSRFYLQ